MTTATPDPRPPSSSAGAWTAAAIVIAISLLSTFTISTDDTSNVQAGGAVPEGGFFVNPNTGEALDEGGVTEERRVVTGGGGTSGGGGGAQQVAGTEGSEGTGTGGSSGAGGTADCSQGNLGATEIGVTAKEINFAATVVKTGVAKDFLSEAQTGIDAVVQKVNRQGGICKRLIRMKYDDDGWVPSKGQQFIRGYITDKKYFGLAVNPSSEGLLGASQDVEAEGFPVIGADGMLKDQYQNPWIWPVATSTHSTMHIMCQNAYDDGARSFAIVYESNYRFGVEGAQAFEGCVKRRKGAKLVQSMAIQGGQQGYQTQANDFVGACGGDFSDCDFVALLLEPATAQTWRSGNGMGDGSADQRPKLGFGAPQPLFVESFVKDCGAPCANLQVWTSFKPPIDPFDKEAPVQTYVNDLRAISSSADASNPHVQGAYVGMLLVKHVLEEMGAEPTREKAREILDSTTLETGLAPPMSFSEGNHFAATSAQAFEAIFNITSGSATFTGWRYTNSGFKADNEVKKDL